MGKPLQNAIFPVNALSVSTAKMTNEQWLEARRSGLGGSDAGAVLGVNRYSTPVGVYLDKTGQAEPTPDNIPMAVGRELEDLVARIYAERRGEKVVRRRFMDRHPEYRFMLANIDRKVVGKQKGLECKTASVYTSNKWGPSGSDYVPDEYLIQCQHYMIVENLPVMDLAVLIGNAEFRWYEIGFDRSLADIIIEREARFWNEHVLTGVAPEPVTLQDVADLYPQANGEVVDLGDRGFEVFQSLKQVKKEIGELEDRKEALEIEFKAMIAANSAAEYVTATSDRVKLATWNNQTTNRIDANRLKTERPDIYQAFLKPSDSRVLRLSNVAA